ncbi:hypothetical protein ACFQ7J_21765 [Streptomyces sp. NPDC056501]|uniref:hypothetical protein n=1 Tax=Streptomyces sp. NPDC056501 TaxID=3345841 RepID=UPI0036B94364
MNDFFRMIRAMASVRTVLSEAAGPQWPKLSTDLDALLEKVRSGGLSEELAVYRLQALMRPYPAVLELAGDAFTSSPVFEDDPLLALWHTADWDDIAPVPRFVNLAIQSRSSAPAVVSRGEPLDPNSHYYLRVDIGHASKDSIVVGARQHPFPEEHLPETTEGHWLDVGVTSSDFEVVTPEDTFFLPRHGPSWSCACRPHEAHSCYPDQRHRYVFLAVRTPAAAGTAHARVTIWAYGHVVQSLLVTAEIAPPGQPGQVVATVDYTLTADMTDLDELQPRGLSVVTNQRPDGTHTLTFRSGDELGFTLAEDVLVSEMSIVRDLLFKVHAKTVEGSDPKNVLDARNGKCKDDFIRDLSTLARKGWTMWTALFSQQPASLTQATSGPTTVIQVARVPSTTFVYPWAAVYDIPLDMDSDAQLTPCAVAQTWDSEARMFPGYPDRCPHEDTHAVNTLCPFGFWGIRHIIENPPSSVTPSRQVRIVQARHMVVVRSSKLSPNLTTRHCKAVAKTLTGFTLTTADSVEETGTALSVSDLQLVEFYCHGKGDPTDQWLEVGDGQKIYPSQIVTWHRSTWAPRDTHHSHWEQTTPLVLLNGCHTTAMTPQSPVNFVDVFAAVHAAGVVGTEISLLQPMAGEAVELLLHHFHSEQHRMGEALRRMRHDLLAKGNLLGLAYTAYCSADLQLVHVPLTQQ